MSLSFDKYTPKGGSEQSLPYSYTQLGGNVTLDEIKTSIIFLSVSAPFDF